MKKALQKFFTRDLVWIVGIIGLPVFFWITWVQSCGFVYIELGTFIMLTVISVVLGLISVRYVKVKQGAKLKDLKSMIIGDCVCFILCVIISYTAYMISYYYMGAFGMGFCLGNIWYCLWWIRDIEKAEKKNGEAAES